MFEGKEFLTIQEAVELTKKAPNTIRSLVTSCKQDSTKVVTKKKGKKFTYLIYKKYLLEYFELPTHYQENDTKKNQDVTNMVSDGYQDNTNILPDENIEFYRELIRSQQEQIKNLQKLLENQQLLNLETTKRLPLQEPNFVLVDEDRKNKNTTKKRFLWW